jgi:hypothetical protein
MKTGDKVIFNKEKHYAESYKQYYDKIYTIDSMDLPLIFEHQNHFQNLTWLTLREIPLASFRCDLFLSIKEIRKQKLMKICSESEI